MQKKDAFGSDGEESPGSSEEREEGEEVEEEEGEEAEESLLSGSSTQSLRSIVAHTLAPSAPKAVFIASFLLCICLTAAALVMLLSMYESVEYVQRGYFHIARMTNLTYITAQARLAEAYLLGYALSGNAQLKDAAANQAAQLRASAPQYMDLHELRDIQYPIASLQRAVDIVSANRTAIANQPPLTSILEATFTEKFTALHNTLDTLRKRAHELPTYAALDFPGNDPSTDVRYATMNLTGLLEEYRLALGRSVARHVNTVAHGPSEIPLSASVQTFATLYAQEATSLAANISQLAQVLVAGSAAPFGASAPRRPELYATAISPQFLADAAVLQQQTAAMLPLLTNLSTTFAIRYERVITLEHLLATVDKEVGGVQSPGTVAAVFARNSWTEYATARDKYMGLLARDVVDEGKDNIRATLGACAAPVLIIYLYMIWGVALRLDFSAVRWRTFLALAFLGCLVLVGMGISIKFVAEKGFTGYVHFREAKSLADITIEAANFTSDLVHAFSLYAAYPTEERLEAVRVAGMQEDKVRHSLANASVSASADAFVNLILDPTVEAVRHDLSKVAWRKHREALRVLQADDVSAWYLTLSQQLLDYVTAQADPPARADAIRVAADFETSVTMLFVGLTEPENTQSWYVARAVEALRSAIKSAPHTQQELLLEWDRKVASATTQILSTKQFPSIDTNAHAWVDVCRALDSSTLDTHGYINHNYDLDLRQRTHARRTVVWMAVFTLWSLQIGGYCLWKAVFSMNVDYLP